MGSENDLTNAVGFQVAGAYILEIRRTSLAVASHPNPCRPTGTRKAPMRKLTLALKNQRAPVGDLLVEAIAFCPC